MPEIEFNIDTETGKCETEIKGIQGAACEKAAQQLKSFWEIRRLIKRRKNISYSRKPSNKSKANETRDSFRNRTGLRASDRRIVAGGGRNRAGNQAGFRTGK
jgi:hypothetical protein